MIEFLKAADNWILYRLFAPLTGWFHQRSGQDQFQAAREFLKNGSLLCVVALLMFAVTQPSFWSIGSAILLIPFIHIILVPQEIQNIAQFERAQNTPMSDMMWPFRLFWVALFILGFGPLGDLISGISDLGFFCLVASQYFRACTLPPPKKEKKLVPVTSL